ncbi:alpha-L-fucosidase [Thermaurantiacus sp.]
MAGWFEDARFGLFVHWGPYARAGWEASWPLVGGAVTLPLGQDLSAAAYRANAVGWVPDVAAPARWVKAAKDAGMRYAVLTSRHHDGWSLWPSRAAGAHGVGVAGPDIVGAFVAACRAEGLRAGLYYSLPDWSHPDYPPFTDAMRPYRFGGYPMPSPEAWARYRAYLLAQIDELLDYGPDLLWFDGGWERTAEQWDSAAIAAAIRARAPDCLVNDRLPGFGDYATPEQFIPPEPPEGQWETCLTMNRSWGFNAGDNDYKSPAMLVHTLAEVAGRGGNLLLNAGPDGAGNIPPPQRERLEALGRFVSANGAALFGTRAGLKAWQFPGPTTVSGNRVFCFCLMRPVAPVPVRGVPVRHLQAVTHVASGEALPHEIRMPVLDELMGRDGPGEVLVDLPERLMGEAATVFALDFDCDPRT